MPDHITIAFFVTDHGFGHACRAAAVMEAFLRLDPQVRFEVFTTSPRYIFEASIGDGFGYHPVSGDIGMVQLNPLQEDLSATCDQLDMHLPYHQTDVADLASDLNRLNCRMVICDIAPLGIEAALAAGLPSVLIENFTWDWIYRGYHPREQRFGPHIDYLASIFHRADHHIQTQPLCNPATDAFCTEPISRQCRTSRKEVRRKLGIAEEEKMVLLSMGGVSDAHAFLSLLPDNLDWHLVVAGAEGQHPPRKKVTQLPTHSEFFHPDLMSAADAAVGKAGYSTVAEVYHSGIPFGYIKRPHSPESAVLEAFIDDHLPSRVILASSYASGGWIEEVPALLSLGLGKQRTVNGADDVAAYLSKLLGRVDG